MYFIRSKRETLVNPSWNCHAMSFLSGQRQVQTIPGLGAAASTVTASISSRGPYRRQSKFNLCSFKQ